MAALTSNSNQTFNVLDTYNWFNEGQSCRIFVSNLKNTFGNATSSLSILRTIFEQVGPVRNINMNNNSSIITCVVNYYSVEAVARAIAELQDTPFNKTRLKLRKDRRKDKSTFDRTLWVGYCVEMANAVLSHNGWSSEITRMDKASDESTVTAQVTIHIFKTESTTVQGGEELTLIGECTESMTNRGHEQKDVHKRIVEQATVKAFEQLRCVRVRLASGMIKNIAYPAADSTGGADDTMKMHSTDGYCEYEDDHEDEDENEEKSN